MITYFKVASIDSLAFKSNDCTTDELVDGKYFAVFERDSPRNVLEHSYVLFLVIDERAVFELTVLVDVLFLAKDSHDVIQDTWLQLLLFEQSTENDSLLEWLDVEDVVNELYILGLLPFHLC